MRTSVLLLLGILLTAGCQQVMPSRAAGPKLSAIVLPEQYNTPDGMAVDAQGDILLCCPNFNDEKYGARIVRISPRHRITEVVALPAIPEAGKPLGIDVGSDGHLYVADCQAFTTPEHKSRLLRVVMQGGRAVRVEAVVTGFIMSNAVVCRGDSVYVTESKFSTDPKPPLRSGVYRFKLSELKGEAPIALKHGGDDPHVIARLETQNMEWAGANGMGFAADGSLYVCNFADAQLLRFALGPDGKATGCTVVAEGQGMKSCDGMKVHPTTGEVFIADFLGNAVHKVDPKTGKVTTLLRSENNDGTGGQLDRPSEPCIRGRRLYVSNIDLPLVGNTYDKPHTLSVIELGP